ncbi:MAG: serine hydrolase, partial [Vulcanisaeta sp.]|nr:serine hydrolase [Vulcanisaeta sp.]
TRYTEEVTILVPEEIRYDYVRCYALINGTRIPAEFYIGSNKVYLIYERFKLERKGPT